MSAYHLLMFCAVYVLAVATPGPGVAAVLARSLARGLHGAPAFIVGFVAGDLVLFTIAATGLAALARTAATAFIVIKYAGAAYLLFMAYRLWRAQPTSLDGEVPEQKPGSAFLGSFALTVGNPKAIIFFLALLPTMVRLEKLTISGFLEIAVCIIVLQPLVLGSYAVTAARARRLFKSPRAIQIMQRTTGAALAGAAVAVATR